MKKIFVFLTILIFGFVFPGLIIAASTPFQDNSHYNTPSIQAPADGTSTETVKILLQDINKDPVIGHLVSLSSSNDSTATFPKNDQITDVNGEATFTVATTTPGVVKISLYDSTNNIIFSDWISLTFYSTKLGCQNVPSAPILTSVISNANNMATVTWTNSANPVSNYLVSYGTTSKNYIYGNSNVGPQGTTSYTVGRLTGNKKYYFVVAANNNCGRSGFSNEMSTVVKPTSIVSAPTSFIKPLVSPKPTLMAISTPLVTQDPQIILQGTPEKKNVNIRDLGIGIIAFGVLFIGIATTIQGIKNKNTS